MGKPNPQNLIPVKLGEVRNPKGRPKGARSRKTIMREWLEAGSVGLKGFSVQDEMVLEQIKKALKGDTGAFKELMDGLHGRVAQDVKLGNAPGEEFRVGQVQVYLPVKKEEAK